MAGCDCICFIVENDHHNWVGGRKKRRRLRCMRSAVSSGRRREGPPPGVRVRVGVLVEREQSL